MPVLTSIHVAKATRLPMRSVEHATVEAAKGIVGDRYHGTRHRHVTVQSAAALRAATEAFGSDDTIGRGAQEALRRRGGSVCRVLEGGEIAVGDRVELGAG